MRGKRIPIKFADPDPVYGNRQVSKLINQVMIGGKKSIARRHIYGAFEAIKTETKQDPVRVFETALAQVTPKMEVRSRRVGGASYQVPMPVRGPRGASLALRWIVGEARKRQNREYHTFSKKLAAELISASKGEGGAVGKRSNSHRQADSNKAFSHFRW